MNKYKTTFETWNKVASLYEEHFMDLDLYNDSYDTFCEAIEKSNPKILEIGCGPGNITKYMLSKRPDFDLEGIDIAPNMIELAKKNNPNATFRVMDSRNIDQLKTEYDGIICGFCIPYLSKSDCSKLVKDIKNLFSEKGILYLSFIEGDYEKSGYQSGSSGDQVYFYYHDLESIQTDLSENGFEITNISHKDYTRKDGTSEIHTILIARK
ncbi:class I SAM-dependent DNA methyltransferase [Flavobacterium soli]|uniref:class I SAM-dependent DNA methyltransferase n=1 Tax=Flavobacterium soli TaxID=344881 RepID=UPI00047E5C2A|nr:class I SAM-dependent methyltransferase [Flavobacterium soli]